MSKKKNHKKTKEHQKKVKDDITVYQKKLLQYIEKFIGIDPGVSYLFTGYDM
jgi:hypothetical protein